jgi:hypothetical protein
MDMTKDEILRDARNTVARVSRSLSEKRETTPDSVGPNRLDAWREDTMKREAEFRALRAARKAAEDAERDDGAAWRAYISSEIRSAIVAASSGIAEHLAEEWAKIGAALDRRDKQIGKIELELARTQAELAKLTARVIQSEIADADGHAKTIDLPNPLHKVVN